MSLTAYILKSTLSGMTSNFDRIRDNLSLPDNLAKILVNFFYSFLICVCATSLIGIIGLMCCKKLNFKYAIYVSCVFFFAFGAFSFLGAVLFSYLVPTLNWTCNFLDTALESRVGFISTYLII